MSAEGDCPPVAPRAARAQWPAPPKTGAFDVVHFGEAHWNEGQGPKTMPILVQDMKAFDPDLVAFSSDIADIGTPDRLGCFRMIMRPHRSSRHPLVRLAGQSRSRSRGRPGGVANGKHRYLARVFADMPTPWGDDGTRQASSFPRARPDDGEGASTHYYFDYGPAGNPVVRLIALDNSQHSLTTSDVDQYPAVGPAQQMPASSTFLERVASEAERGRAPELRADASTDAGPARSQQRPPDLA